MNRLSDSTSLYLQQHADNPVEWHPWDNAALDRARDLDRPILLSIGYSACHWCHVMAHESFEDEATARWMNELFVNIKVDREERPDLDRVYQLSHQLLTGRGGGWPLTVFLDPGDLTPFFAGTYFPPVPSHGLPAFSELLKKIRQWFDEHRDQVGEQNRQLAEAISKIQQGHGHSGLPGKDIFESALQQLSERYDRQHGGFGGAPKFPQAPLLALVQAIARQPDSHSGKAGQMLHETLTQMASSGLRDHLDGGFFRYTVDDSWTIPHFEKMLYDNAMLLPLYAEAAQELDDPFLAAVAAGIVDWLGSEMCAGNGAFFASIDADAGGEEGGFHVWQRDEIKDLLDNEEYAGFADIFALDRPPNFEGRSWHLVRNTVTDREIPESALRKLRAARALRVPPGTDTKLLTSWNALCVEGLARAGAALHREDWLDLAESAMDFLHSTMWVKGQLNAVHARGRTRFAAYLDDHAYLLNALLILMQDRCKPGYLDFAIQLADTLLDRFEDPDRGGFYFTQESQPVPIHRMRPIQDDATPAGNGIAARALLTLGHLTGDARFLDSARRTLESAAAELGAHPLAHSGLLLALADLIDPPVQVIIIGTDKSEIDTMRYAAKEAIPGHHQVNCYAFGPDAGGLRGILGNFDRSHGTRALVCRGLQCLPPVETTEELKQLLKATD
jgi:uncharacterized protein YyaL (SSP411 family)